VAACRFTKDEHLATGFVHLPPLRWLLSIARSHNLMATKSVQELLDDIRLLGDEQLSLTESVRKLVKQTIPSVTEEVKYGGLLFASGVQFCGVFAYKQHVSVEFGSGAKISDTRGHLEGSGKGRRHLKLHSEKDIQAKALAHYLPLALEATRSGA
jgi:hypothetical protein